MSSGYWYREIERLETELIELKKYKQNMNNLKNIVNYLVDGLYEMGHKLIYIGDKFIGAYKDSNRPLDLSINVVSTGNSDISKSRELEVLGKNIETELTKIDIDIEEKNKALSNAKFSYMQAKKLEANPEVTP